MAETKLVVEHREHLWNLLMEASQVEHLIMCQYLYASFSLKTGTDEGLTATIALITFETSARCRAEPDQAELPAPLGVPAGRGAVRAAAVRRRRADALPVPGAP